MVDPGELVNKTLIREFSEEALSSDLAFDKSNVKARNKFERKLAEFFKKGGIQVVFFLIHRNNIIIRNLNFMKLFFISLELSQIYRGYVDDPRNTDNSWMETHACNFHDEYSNTVGKFRLSGGDDAENARWLDLNKDLDLFASHIDFLRAVASIHQAHW
jgi:ADP-ribose pyrophosphatase